VSFNSATVIVGPPQYGKTTIARDVALAFLREHPKGLVMAHDPNRQFRDFCRTYETAADWRAKLARAASKSEPFARGASIGGSAAELAQVAIELGRRWNTADRVRVPLLLVYDESSLLETSGSSHIGQADTQLLSNRRHWGIGPIYNVQRPTALTEAFYSMATDVYILAQPSERRTGVLEEYLGLKGGALSSLVGAPKFRFAHWRAGEGLV